MTNEISTVRVVVWAKRLLSEIELIGIQITSLEKEVKTFIAAAKRQRDRENS